MTPNIYSLESPEGIREIVAALLMGYNYRLIQKGRPEVSFSTPISGSLL